MSVNDFPQIYDAWWQSHDQQIDFYETFMTKIRMQAQVFNLHFLEFWLFKFRHSEPMQINDRSRTGRNQEVSDMYEYHVTVTKTPDKLR